MSPAGRSDAAAPPRWAWPAHWRRVDLVSDLHLGPALPRTSALWAGFLRACDADALLILGDLFEVWVGDDAAALPQHAPLVAELAAASARLPLYFMAGNRDFLAGETLMHASGMQRLPDPCCAELPWGGRVLLSHGDALCLSDLAYQEFRRTVRSAPWQQAFLARPLDERLAIAADIRRRSDERRRFDGEPDADVDAAEARRWLQLCGTTVLVHGHTHRPGSGPLGSGCVRHVLSDWDVDDRQRPRAEVLRLHAGGVQRYDPRDIAAA